MHKFMKSGKKRKKIVVIIYKKEYNDIATIKMPEVGKICEEDDDEEESH